MLPFYIFLAIASASLFLGDDDASEVDQENQDDQPATGDGEDDNRAAIGSDAVLPEGSTDQITPAPIDPAPQTPIEDTLRMGDEDDVLDLTDFAPIDAPTLVEGGAGDDTIELGEVFSTELFGQSGDDLLTVRQEASDGADIYGGAGEDTLNAQEVENGLISGGAGNDVLNLSNARISFGGTGYQLLAEGGSGDDTLTYDGAGEVLSAQQNLHRLSGGEGADVYRLTLSEGGALPDPDTFEPPETDAFGRIILPAVIIDDFDAIADQLEIDVNPDDDRYNRVSYDLIWEQDDLGIPKTTVRIQMAGDNGLPTRLLEVDVNGAHLNQGDVHLGGRSYDLTIIGGETADTFGVFTEDSLLQTLSAGSGDDTVTATSYGNATISGGAGDDVLNVGQGTYGRVDAGSGDDTLSLALGSRDEILGGPGDDVLQIGMGNEYPETSVVDAGSGDDNVTVSVGVSFLPSEIAFGPSPTINLGPGSDTLRVAFSDVTLFEGEEGFPENDTAFVTDFDPAEDQLIFDLASVQGDNTLQSADISNGGIFLNYERNDGQSFSVQVFTTSPDITASDVSFLVDGVATDLVTSTT